MKCSDTVISKCNLERMADRVGVERSVVLCTGMSSILFVGKQRIGKPHNRLNFTVQKYMSTPRQIFPEINY